MNTSDNGLEFLEDVEGVCLKAYKDGGGVWTIGVGHTSDSYFTVTPTSTITFDKCRELLRLDVAEAEKAIEELVIVSLTQNQYDALISFIFNVGVEQFTGSTLLKKLNAGDYAGASAQFPRWDMDNGKHVPGLYKRRLLEQALFNKA